MQLLISGSHPFSILEAGNRSAATFHAEKERMAVHFFIQNVASCCCAHHNFSILYVAKPTPTRSGVSLPGEDFCGHVSGSVAVQFDVQVDELSEETPVGDDTSSLFNRVNGLHQGQVVLQHQIRQHDGGRAAHAHVAVHQDFTCSVERET